METTFLLDAKLGTYQKSEKLRKVNDRKASPASIKGMQTVSISGFYESPMLKIYAATKTQNKLQSSFKVQTAFYPTILLYFYYIILFYSISIQVYTCYDGVYVLRNYR